MSLKTTELKNGFFISTIAPVYDTHGMFETMVLNRSSFAEVSKYTNWNRSRKMAIQYHKRLAKRLQSKIFIDGVQNA